MFSEIHLNGPPNTWPIRCPDSSKKHFYLVQPDNSLIPDPGGIITHKNFYRNLQNSLLELINIEISKVLRCDTESDEFNNVRDNLLDNFDLQVFQTRALEIGTQKSNAFVRHLIEEMGIRGNKL